MASEFKFTDKYLNKYGKEVVSEIKTRLSGLGKKATGGLINSIKYKIAPNDLTLSFYMNEYGKYVDKGVSGAGIVKGFKGKKKKVEKGQLDVYDKRVHKFGSKMPPDNSAFRKWLKVKGIDKGASFAIRRSVWMFGIAPTNFFTIPTTRRQKQFEQGVGDVIAQDIDKQLEKELKK